MAMDGDDAVVAQAAQSAAVIQRVASQYCQGFIKPVSTFQPIMGAQPAAPGNAGTICS